MIEALADAVLTINNVNVAYVPNSLKYNNGNGEKSVRSQSSGGGGAQAILTIDTATQFSTLAFSLYPTKTNIELVADMQVNGLNNAMSITGPDSFSVSFANMAVTNEPDIEIGVDTVISLEFAGTPAV